MDTDLSNQTKKINIFNQEERPILCIANEHDYLGDGTMIHEDELQVGQQYTFVRGEAKSYGSMVHLKELPGRYGYQSYFFEELQPYDAQIFEKACSSWLEKMLEMGESAIKTGKRIAQTSLNVGSPVVSMLPSIHPALLYITLYIRSSEEANKY